MDLKGIFEQINKENYRESVQQMYKIQESDKRGWDQLSEFEKDVYCWLTDDLFNADRVNRIQNMVAQKVT